jgi:signal transduction histidine kinase
VDEVFVTVDSTRMAQVISSFIANAVKYSKRGSTVEVLVEYNLRKNSFRDTKRAIQSASRFLSENKYGQGLLPEDMQMTIAVTDHGRGIGQVSL